MTAHWENKYSKYLVSDNSLCIPVLPQENLAVILLRTHELAEKIIGDGEKPKVAYDLEHLQVAEYTNFPPITDQQKEEIQRITARQPIRSEEMAFLALRSLIDLFWDDPQSEDDIRRAAAYDLALEKTLKEVSPYVGKSLAKHDSPLPYWGRLGFLRVMTTIPDEQIDALDLQQVSCVLIKDPAFNARSFQYTDFGLIGLNFALEPILKGLNRMLLHYFHSQSMSGPKRLERAWNSILPIVAYFWAQGNVAVNRLSQFHMLFNQDMVSYAHSITASQIDFIIRHELAHLVLDHGRQIKVLQNSKAKDKLRHEFEFEADAFAQNSLRSVLYNGIRSHLQWGDKKENDEIVEKKMLEVLHGHQAEVSGVRLLFTYMDTIDKIGKLLKSKLGDSIRFRSTLDTHPTPSERLRRLDTFQFGEDPPTSKLLRYADSFFTDVIDYASDLDDEAIESQLKNLY